jgi:putative FmdB family regulatory protein
LPLYEYRCTQCGHRFEKIQSFNAEPETECPKCHGALMRPLTAPALQFKGAGWYVNDYAPKAASGSTDSKPADASAGPAAESKPAATESTAKPAATDSSSSASSESSSKPTTTSTT